MRRAQLTTAPSDQVRRRTLSTGSPSGILGKTRMARCGISDWMICSTSSSGPSVRTQGCDRAFGTDPIAIRRAHEHCRIDGHRFSERWSRGTRLMGSPTSRFFRDHILVKRPGNSTITPRHQDQPYYCVEGERTVSFWTPLDRVSRSVSLECVAGSHRWNTAGYRPKRFDGSPLYPDDQFEDVPDIDAQREQLVIRGWDMEPGDAIAFDFRTIHGAPANASPVTRRVFSSRWVGSDARFVRRGASGSPPFPNLTLEDGAPFDAPEFPLVYSQGLGGRGVAGDRSRRAP
jgi:hypothetical protein